MAPVSASPRILTALEPELEVAEFRRVLVESGLGATRPVDDPARLARMIAGADLVVTARLDTPGQPLVGVARGINDHAWSCYLSELAVSKPAQGLGVGRALLRAVRLEIGPEVALILASVTDATGFYEKVGMSELPHCYWFKRQL